MTRSDSARRPAVVQHAFDALVAALRSRLHQGRDIPIDACDRFDHSLADLAGTTIAGAREAGAGDGVAPSLPVLAQLPGAFVAARDAVHVAMAATAGMDYLLTWNCRHLANASLRGRISEVCRTAGHRPPTICTPEELREVMP